jgi:transposase
MLLIMEVKRPFSEADWLATPEPVRRYVEQLEQTVFALMAKVEQLEKRIEQLESSSKKISQNSSKPPSSDSPYEKPKRKKTDKKTKRKRGAQKGHKGHQQAMLPPTEQQPIVPERCPCGNHQLASEKMKPYYTHQQIELPEIKMDVIHYVLHKCRCPKCGKMVKAQLPTEYQAGYGPRLSALIAEMSGTQGNSRETVQGFCKSVLGFSISIGAIQNVIDRASEAIEPYYQAIGEVAHSSRINHIDETSWFQSGTLKWLWVMANMAVSYFMIHSHRSKEAFLALIGSWQGILVSDDYGLYRSWVEKRQTCLAHLIRKAKALSERKTDSIREFGQSVLKELRLLCHWAKAPPSQKQWTDFYSRFILLLFLFENAQDEAGTLARRLLDEMDSLWLFLEEEGVEPTNNFGERALRFGVLWRKRSNGTQSDKGDRWVERILSLKQTCRTRSLPVFPLLVDAIKCYFKEQKPDLAWLA